MTETLRPETPDQLREAVAWASSAGSPLEVTGAATKRAFGRPCQTSHRLDLSGLAGITDYEPAELVMSAQAATPLADIEAALAATNQQLAFEPPDFGQLLGTATGAGTIGGAIACNLAGPRRVKAGAARDHIIGFHAVSGRGEDFKSGGRVVKNVTGFDLSKLMAGSFGTLAVMADVNLKVMPAPERTRTVLVYGAPDEVAAKALAQALGSAFDVSGAAHLPAEVAAGSGVDYVAGAGKPVTAVRIEGTGASVDYRCRALRENLAEFGETEELHSSNSAALWREVANGAYFATEADTQIWRVSAAPSTGPRLAAEVCAETGGRAYYDWGGGLVWLALPPTPDASHEAVRRALAAAGGGHATLLRAAEAVRAAVPVFQPQDEALAALSARVKDAFDPKCVLNPGRMYAGI
jgi:glycolate oxidase FAD binding subunit